MRRQQTRGGTVAGVEVKNFDSPDETRPFEGKGEARVVSIGGHIVGMSVFEPGWRWSQNVKPIAKTDDCEGNHLLYCVSGRMKVAMTDGGESEIGPGDVAAIEPHHDAWIVGDEPCVMVDFGGFAQYAKR
jgi:hypothetical protein